MHELFALGRYNKLTPTNHSDGSPVADGIESNVHSRHAELQYHSELLKNLIAKISPTLTLLHVEAHTSFYAKSLVPSSTEDRERNRLCASFPEATRDGCGIWADLRNPARPLTGLQVVVSGSDPNHVG